MSSCAGPLALIPWGPLLTAALSSRAGDSETQQVLNEYQRKGDWAGLARYAAERLGANRRDSDWWLVLGYARLQQGDRAAAAEAFTRVTELNPEDIDGWNLLAEMCVGCIAVYRALPARAGAACALASPSQASMMASAMFDNAHCRTTAPRSKAARGMP